MALNVTGGALSFEAEVSIDNALKNVKILTDSFNNALQSNKGKVVLDQLGVQLTKLTNQAKIYQDAINSNKVTEPTAVKSLNDGLKKTQSQIAIIQQLIKTLGSNDTKPIVQGFDNTTESGLKLQTRLRSILNDLATMRAEGKDATPDFAAKLGEAKELAEAIKGVRTELQLSTNNVAGFEALGSAFRGLIGGAEALAGTMGLFTNDAAQAEEITKNLISIQSILNGVNEVGAILEKKSQLNVYLLGLQRKFATGAAAEQAVATKAVAAAETEGIAAAEGATVAQEGLNAAMLANPVAVILPAVIALYGAYQILSNTVLKASDAEKRRKASLDALSDAEKKAAESSSQEQAQLNILISTAQNKLLTDEERSQAISKLRSQYPEYLSNLNLENIYTKNASDAIKQQIGLMKARALEQAAEEVYAEKLKKVAEAQNKVNDINREGASIWQKIGVVLKHTFDTEGFGFTTSSVLKDRMEDLNDATTDANGAFDTFQQTQLDLAKRMGNTTDAIEQQIGAFSRIGNSLNQTNNQIEGIIGQGNKNIDEILKGLHKPFDPKTFDAEKERIRQLYQYQVDQAKEGTAQSIKAQLELQRALLAKDQTNPNLFDVSGNPISQKNDKEANAKALELLGQYQKSITDLETQLTQKSLQNITAASAALVLGLQAAGQQGSDAYFSAQKKALITAAHEQLVLAQDNAGERLRIEKQLDLDLANLDKEQQKQKLENERSITQIKLNLAKQGSQEEMQLQLKLIDIAAQEEVIQAGKNQDKINEITSNAEKQKAELVKKYAIESAETEINIRIAALETQLAAVREGSDEELNLKKQLIDQKAALDIEDKKSQIKNEKLLAAEIQKINAEALTEKKKAENDYINQLLQDQFAILTNQKTQDQAHNNFVINDPFSSNTSKAKAELDNLVSEGLTLQKQINAINDQIASGKGDITQLKNQLDALHAQKDQNTNDQVVQNLKVSVSQLENISTITASISSAFATMATQVGDVNSKLAQALNSMSQMADTASAMLGALAKGGTDIGADIGAATSIIKQLVQPFIDAGKTAKASKKEIQDFYDAIAKGEIDSAIASRQAAREREQQNAKNLQGLKDEYNLLKQQQQQNTTEYNNLLNQLYNESFIAGEHSKKDFFKSGLNTVTVQDLASLAGKSFDEILALYNKGQLTDKAKALFEQLQKLANEGKDIQSSLNSLQDELNQTLTGTTAQSIADSIRQGLADGKKSVADFADDFNSLMSNAILSAFEAKQIEPAIEEFYKRFSELSSGSGGALSAQQIEELRNLYNQDITSFTNQLQQLQQISGINFGQGANANSLVGGIKAMSEQTAELIAGQLGGMRIAGLSQVEQLKTATSFLTNIEANTAQTAVRMQKLLDKFDAYETGAKKLSVN